MADNTNATQLAGQAKDFYNTGNLSQCGRSSLTEWEKKIVREARTLNTPNPLILELGCGKTNWREITGRYVAYDLGFGVLRFRDENAVQGDMQQLPFPDRSIDFIFSIAAIEHVPKPELVYEEVARVLKSGGRAFLAPAWFCRPWAAKGLPIRSYSELTWKDKVLKASLMIRNNILWRSILIIPKRVWRELLYFFKKSPTSFTYQRLDPNLEEYIMSDSDAFTSMDPHSVLLYFASRGFDLEPDSIFKRVLFRKTFVVVSSPLI